MTSEDRSYSLIRKLMDSAILTLVRVGVLIRHPRLSHRYSRMALVSRFPDVADPPTANEKFFWRKIFDHDPCLTRVTDKIDARNWLSENDIVADMPDLIWTGTDAANIPDDALRGGVVVKGAHGYNMNIFLPEPPRDRDAFNAQANAFLGHDHGTVERQWAYENVPRRLLVERFLPGAISDLKFYTFGGHVERLVAIYDRFGKVTADVWRRVDGKLTLSDTASVVGENMARRPLPPFIDEAQSLCERIGAHFDHMRVDLMSDGERFWLGELTVYNLGGHFDGVPAEDSVALCKAWDLRRSWFLTSPQSGWRGIYRDALLRRLNAR